ncbi:XdhC family protein [Streptomyces sp. MAR4 CNX-425]|uniref:XdhC family protein n=1 Tax=Streptomyces sp. MAR4 CNX-425 TaxID=3406343 RepID=UPI003B503886
MLDIAADLIRWCAEERLFAVATVVRTTGSAPRGPGAALAVDAAGTAVGSVSGGCVEGAVYELCRQAVETGEPLLETFGYSDEDAFAAGLTCGGEIDVLVAPVTPGGPAADVLRTALTAAAEGAAAAVARVVAGPAALLGQALLVRPGGAYEGRLAGPLPGLPDWDGAALERTAAAEAAALLDAGRTGSVTVGAAGARCGEPVTLLVEVSVPAPRMVVFGAVDFAHALVRVGTFLGYRVTLCDARPVFATARRFPEADEVVVRWPHEYLADAAAAGELDGRTVLCVLTHDPKFDVPLLAGALRLPVAYVGAMGSRRTHRDRERRLREAGVTDLELARLHSPIGLDLGARSPEEVAVSIAGEIVAARRGGTGLPLTGGHTPIHPEPGRAAGEAGRIGDAA